MTSFDRQDRALADLLAQLVAPAPVDDLDLILTRTAAMRQRPAWTFLERWLPMVSIARSVRSTAPVPWRWAGVLALLLVALLAAYLVGGGAPTRLPAPLVGPTANGVLVLARGGSVVTIDPATGDEVARADGAAPEQVPVFSPDGTQVAFERPAAGGTQLIVAKADLTNEVLATPDPVQDLRAWSFSPDGRSLVALAVVEAQPRLILVSADGSRPVRVLPGSPTLGDSPPQFHPTDEGRVLYLEQTTAGRAVATVDIATDAVRILTAPASDADIHFATLSPDGTRIAYGTYDPTSTEISARSWVMAADGSAIRRVDDAPGTVGDVPGPWSNDGARLVILRFPPNDASPYPVIVTLDGSREPVDIVCPLPDGPRDCSIEVWTWSPDDRYLVGRVTGSGGLDAVTIDTATGAASRAPWSDVTEPRWQRVAAP